MSINVKALREAADALQAAAPDCRITIVMSTDDAGDVADAQAHGRTAGAGGIRRDPAGRRPQRGRDGHAVRTAEGRRVSGLFVPDPVGAVSSRFSSLEICVAGAIFGGVGWYAVLDGSGLHPLDQPHAGFRLRRDSDARGWWVEPDAPAAPEKGTATLADVRCGLCISNPGPVACGGCGRVSDGPSPRYVVKTAAEMAGMEGRMCLPFSAKCGDRTCAQLNDGGTEWSHWGESPWGSEPGSARAIIDTRDGWTPKSAPVKAPAVDAITAPAKRWGLGLFEWDAEPDRSAPPKTAGPSDAEIVAAWDAEMQARELLPLLAHAKTDRLHLKIGGDPNRAATILLAQYKAARSRELGRRIKESEAKRRLPCRGDDAEDVGRDVPTQLVDLCDPFARRWL